MPSKLIQRTLHLLTVSDLLTPAQLLLLATNSNRFFCPSLLPPQRMGVQKSRFFLFLQVFDPKYFEIITK
jgi:hypothetical protein